jgi:hypothetical protein
MNYSIEQIIVVFLLFDSVIANIVAWTGREWYRQNFKWMARYFPLTKGWALGYLGLVVWILVLVK